MDKGDRWATRRPV